MPGGVALFHYGRTVAIAINAVVAVAVAVVVVMSFQAEVRKELGEAKTEQARQWTFIGKLLARQNASDRRAVQEKREHEEEMARMRSDLDILLLFKSRDREGSGHASTCNTSPREGGSSDEAQLEELLPDLENNLRIRQASRIGEGPSRVTEECVGGAEAVSASTVTAVEEQVKRRTEALFQYLAKRTTHSNCTCNKRNVVLVPHNIGGAMRVLCKIV